MYRASRCVGCPGGHVPSRQTGATGAAGKQGTEGSRVGPPGGLRGGPAGGPRGTRAPIRGGPSGLGASVVAARCGADRKAAWGASFSQAQKKSYIRVRGQNYLTLSLGAWLVWASATQILVVDSCDRRLRQHGMPKSKLSSLRAIAPVHHCTQSSFLMFARNTASTAQAFKGTGLTPCAADENKEERS